MIGISTEWLHECYEENAFQLWCLNILDAGSFVEQIFMHKCPRIKEVEIGIFAQNPEWAFWYAYDILEGPFPEGEDAIAMVAKWALLYAKHIIQGSWPKGEDAISTSTRHSFNYANTVLNGPFPKGEKIMSQFPESVYLYAKYVLKKRWIIAEDTLRKMQGNDPAVSYYKSLYEHHFNIRL